MRTDWHVSGNPQLRYGRSDRRGFAIAELSPARMRVDLIGLDDVFLPDAAASTVASFVVQNGRPDVQAV